MDIILFTFIVILRFVVVVSDKYKILPPVFKLEDYVTCLEKSYSYCKIEVRLKNDGFNNNDLWNLINDSINDRHGYDRSIIQRGICVPKKDAFNLESVKNFAELRINEEFNGTNLLTLVENVFCITKQHKTGISLYDKLLVFSLVAYMFLILYATIYDRQRRTCTGESTKGKAILSFSLISNWKKICNIEGNDDFKNLKSIQGIRFYNMLLIIALHTLISSGVLYISNTSYTEKLYSTTPAQIFQVLGVFLVQTFFLISSFIVTFQIYNIYRDQGKFTIKQALITITNRFFRIGICSTIVLIILKSSLDTLSDGPHIYDYNYIFRQACKHNWQQTFYFFNNYLHYGDMCQPLAWYLSVDFQLYIFATVLMYFIIKFKLDELKIVSFLILFSCLLYGSVIYFNQMDIILRLNANTLRSPILLRSESTRILYTSTYSNWTTSLVGILLGIQYTKYKNYNFHNNKVRSILWLSIFFGLPSAVILISTYEFKGIQAAILGALIKPLFSLGIGIGILGMSHNMGGIIKRMCENKYILVLSNFAFTTYLFQLFVIFKGNKIYCLVEMKLTEIIKTFFFFDAPASLMVGIVCTLIFEQPGINLQKLFLPQISRGQKRQKSQ